MVKVKAGFTVMEVLIVIAIYAVITAVVFADFPLFGRTLSIERDAQQLALVLREAEQRAVSTGEAGGGFRSPFGVFVTMAAPDKYILFADTRRADTVPAGTTDYYDAGEELEIISFSGRVRLRQLCLKDSLAAPPDDCDTPASEMSLIFERPGPSIRVFSVRGGPDLGEGDYAMDLISESDFIKKRITAWTTGAISIATVTP
jgi:prepilin-type N-terminal cleavage/methylation domain-containing protein